MKYLLTLVFLLSFYQVTSYNYFSLISGYRYLNQQISKQCKSLKNVNVIYGIETKSMDVPVDHFDENNNEMWEMRYFRSLIFWEPDGPVYVFIGGEDEANTDHFKKGLMHDLAYKSKGAMIITEHRYYGNSYVSKDFRYLNSRQAIEDLAKLMSVIRKHNRFKSSKIIVIGGFYAGNLAVWLKAIHPDKVDAVIASSAPVLAEKDFKQYLVQIKEAYELIAPTECWEKIKERFQLYDHVFKSETGTAWLAKQENICEHVNMRLMENQQYFILQMLSEYMACVREGDKKILESCNELKMTSNYTDLTRRRHNFRGLFDNDKHIIWKDDGAKCNDYDFFRTIDFIREIPHLYNWNYQRCTEFGFFETTSSDEQPFSNIPADLFYKMCIGLFGSDFDEDRIDRGVKSTNIMYGGLSPNVTNVIFYSGSLDPYKSLQVSQSNPSNNVTVIEMASWSQNKILFPTDENTVYHEELVKERRKIRRLLRKWLGLKKRDPYD